MNRHEALQDVERRKQVRVRVRRDLSITPQKYEGKTYYVVKDPVSLRYWRFKDKEQFLIELMDGKTTLDDAQKKFEQRFRPDRLTLEDLEHFAQQLMTAGLAHNDTAQVGKQLWESRKKRSRSEWMQMLTNVLYIKIPVFDPDRLLARMVPYTRWIFTLTFLTVSLAVMLAAILLVATHFQVFRDKLPSYHEFFSFKNLTYMWVALGAVKIIHEFGHGLSCKTFGGETHEMGLLFLCLSPCLYCNVSDSWMLPSKWKRIIISSAGIYVELIIAAFSTFVWWNSPGHPFINNMALSLMVVCSVSTIVFNANPLMRYDGYYMMADWLEIPNLRDRSNRFLMRLMQEQCLGIELPPEPHMELGRRSLFVTYAVISYVYRWVVTFSILYFLYMFLKPYKLGAISAMLAIAAAGSMVGWPLFRLGKSIHKRGRLPDMKPRRVTISASVLAALLIFFFLVPLPMARVRNVGLVQVEPTSADPVHLQVTGILSKLHVEDGDDVNTGFILAEFFNLDVENEYDEALTKAEIHQAEARAARKKFDEATDLAEKGKLSTEWARADGEHKRYKQQADELARKKDQLILRAPRDGVVMSPPRIDEVGKQFDKEKPQPFCSVGEKQHYWVLIPVSTVDYRVLKEDSEYAQQRGRDLDVDLRVHGLGAKTWKGKIVQMPESEAKDVPLALTIKAGGPVATKPPSAAAPNVFIPQNQQYLIGVEILNPSDAICPGTLAQVKLHCRWRTCAWWVWRTISSTFDLGLL